MTKIDNKEMIEEIKLTSVGNREFNNKTLYCIKKDKNIPVVFQFIGNELCQYMDYATNSMVWKLDSIENFYKNYIQHINDFLEYKEISKRTYVEPKLPKPSELKGLKQIYSIKCGIRKNQIYKKNNDIWIKDNDYFSTELTQEKAKELGLQFHVREKFMYKNNFSPVILRGEGWICIKNLLLYINDHNIIERLGNKICQFYNWEIDEFYGGELERFYIKLITKLRNMEV